VKSFPAWNNAVQWPDRPAKNQQARQEEGGYSLQQHNKAEFKPLQRKKTEHRVGKQGQSRANMSKAHSRWRYIGAQTRETKTLYTWGGGIKCPGPLLHYIYAAAAALEISIALSRVPVAGFSTPLCTSSAPHSHRILVESSRVE
jgi:hypothetical protein